MSTTIHNLKTLNDSNCVCFNNVFSKIDQYYFDLDTKKWIQCEPINKLPYNLCTYKLKNMLLKNDYCIVTCQDSYRLVTDLKLAPTIEEMISEYEWREQIVNKNAELDFIDNKNVAHKAEVCWTVSDVIHGVILIGPRKYPHIKSFGYYYKESKQLAKSCTYTEILTENQLKQEEIFQKDFELKVADRKIKLKQIKLDSPYVCPSNYIKFANTSSGMCGKIGCFDLRKYYKSLKFYEIPITIELLENNHEFFDKNKITSQEQLILCGLISVENKYDVVYGENRLNINLDGIVRLNEYDAFSDIIIYGATYAKIKCNDEYVDFDFSEVDNTFVLNDITLQNPIFSTMSGYVLAIHTDGTHTTYNGIYIGIEPRRLLNSVDNSYALNWFESKNLILMAGHMWQPSMICKISDMINVEYV